MFETGQHKDGDRRWQMVRENKKSEKKKEKGKMLDELRSLVKPPAEVETEQAEQYEYMRSTDGSGGRQRPMRCGRVSRVGIGTARCVSGCCIRCGLFLLQTSKQTQAVEEEMDERGG